MIIVIRNDRWARFAHEIHGIKIKEEKPMYKILATLQNEGLCIYESANFAEIARTFDIIIEAIQNGEPYIIIHPPVSDKIITREEFDNGNVYDFFIEPDKKDRPLDLDIYGRKLPKEEQIKVDTRDDNRPSQYSEEFNDYYNWEKAIQHKDGSWNNMYYNNMPSAYEHTKDLL